jgi:hypothetical protein
VDCVHKTQSTPVRNNPIQTNFTAGELSPRLKGRVDVNRYNNGVATLKNFVVFPQGGASRRTGTKFIGEVRQSSKATRLIPFEFSTVQAYILEFGEFYIRIYKDEGLLVNGASPVEISTNYSANQLFDISFTQSADILYIVHPSHPPRKLSRTSALVWSIDDITFLDGPYLSVNKTATTLTPGNTATGNTTLTASAALFVSTDVGRFVRFEHSSKNGYGKIVGFTSATSVTIQIIGTLQAVTATKNWRLGAWSNTTGWPACVTFFQERLVFANTPNQPQTIWMSCSGDYENFMPSGVPGGTYPTTDSTVNDDNAITYSIASNKVNAIRWLDATSNLVIGTAGAEWIAKQASTADPLSPTNIQVLQQTTYGSDAVPVRRVGTSALFVQRSGRKIRELQYNFDVDAYIAKDVSILSEHLFTENNYTVDNAFQSEPDSIYWIAMQSGRLIGMTYLKEQEVIAFHQHEFGGSFSGGIAVCESIACIPNVGATSDSLYVIIKRTINGVTKRYIEVVTDAFAPVDAYDKSNMWFVDSGLKYTGAATTTITGLTHLIGQTVAVVANGANRSTAVVNGSGQITLSRAATNVIVGLPYTSTIQTLPLEGGGQAGTAQGKQSRISSVTLRLLNSIGFQAGESETNLDRKEFRRASDPMDESPPLYTGDKSISLNQSYTTERSFWIVQDLPYPLTVLSIMPESVVYK